MTVKEGQKEEEDYYLPSSQYRPNSPSQMLATYFGDGTAPETVQQTVLETAPEKNPEEDAKKNLHVDSEMDYDLDNMMDF